MRALGESGNRTSLLAREVAVLVNDSDPQSVAVADYYINHRGIPVQNVIHVQTPVAASLGAEDFRKLRDKVQRATGPEIQAYAISWTAPYLAGCMSFAAALTLGYSEAYCYEGEAPDWAASPYFDSLSTRPHTDYGMRLSMHLAGATLADVQQLIDRGILSDGTAPRGSAYLIRTTDAVRSNRWLDFAALASPNGWDAGLTGVAIQYFSNEAGTLSNTITGKRDVLFYFTGLETVPDITTNQFLPGAVADHMTSFGGLLDQTAGQMNIVRWLEAGAVASYGTVVEPKAWPDKFPSASVLMKHYIGGNTVIEAYWKSVRLPAQGTFVGDPLARPWAR